MNTFQNKISTWALALAALTMACSPQAEQSGSSSATEQASPAPASNSRNSLDWAGTYKGITPCADCEGIETSVTLYEDGNFRRSMSYLGKEVDNFFTEEGSFEWDEAGAKVSLAAEMGAQRYQVGENVLFHLDQSGARITGELEDMYKLHKNPADYQLESKQWQLIELMGKAYEAAEGGKVPALKFDAIEGRMAGNDGCNQLMGGYELKEGGRIRFNRLAGTLMTCPDMEQADAFRSMLEQVDNYNVSDSALVLNKARMAPMARFVPLNIE